MINYNAVHLNGVCVTFGNEIQEGEIKDQISALLQELFTSNEDSVESGPKTEVSML